MEEIKRQSDEPVRVQEGVGLRAWLTHLELSSRGHFGSLAVGLAGQVGGAWVPRKVARSRVALLAP